MLRYFNSGYFSRTIMLVVLAALLWLPAFLQPAQTLVPAHPAPLYRAFLFLSGNSVFIQLSVAFLLTIASALLINQIAAEFGITGKISQLALLVFVLLSASQVSFTAMSPLIVVNFLMLIFLLHLFKISETNAHIPLVFNASFVLGTAALFYLPATLFVLLLWIALLVFSKVQWRNFAVSLTGLALPFLFAFTWYFWFDQADEARSLLLSALTVHLQEFSITWPIDLIVAVILLVLILVSVVKINSGLMERNINLRKRLIASLNYLAIAFALVLFFSGSSVDSGSLLIAIPASLVLAAALTDNKQSMWYEWTIRLLTLLILFNQYFHLFYAA